MARTVLVTGSSSGIGKATVEYFLERGWNVVGTLRDPSRAGDWAKHSQSLALRLDVTDRPSIAAAIDDAIERFGAIDVVVNNAGYGSVGPFEASTPEQVDRQVATNLTGVLDVCRAILPHFRNRRDGVIVNVTSMGGRVTFPFYSVYHATKWAVEGFTESLTFELAPLGIRVKLVEPGPIKTDFYDRSIDVLNQPGLTAYDDALARAVPRMNDYGTTAPGPEVVARTIFRAATDGSHRLRYPVNAHAILLLRRLLPTRLFLALIRWLILRKS